jgi:hypothetical protein
MQPRKHFWTYPCQVGYTESMQHGTISSYTDRKCRCDACKECARRYYRERRWRLGISKPRPEVQHGSRTMWERGCRCQICMDAHRDRCTKRNRKRGAPRRVAKHGSLSMYNHYHCRCDECVQEHRGYQKLRRLMGLGH